MLCADEISDDLWAVIDSMFPTPSGRRRRPWNDHRLTLEGIVWRFRTGHRGATSPTTSVRCSRSGNAIAAVRATNLRADARSSP
ncbi:transposase [Rhodococcus qingshengii]|nr:transposase [Rhodococcus qingshengii]MDT9662678.1 transposase [Rhodococcus qingshengii]